jgi:hypothetical protein
MITTQLTPTLHASATRGALFAAVAVETLPDSAHDELLCHRSR